MPNFFVTSETLFLFLLNCQLLYAVFKRRHINQAGPQYRGGARGAHQQPQDPGVPGGSHRAAARTAQNPRRQQEDASTTEVVRNQRCCIER